MARFDRPQFGAHNLQGQLRSSTKECLEYCIFSEHLKLDLNLSPPDFRFLGPKPL